MATTAAKKKGNKKVKTLSLTNFPAEDKGGNAPPSYPPTKPTSSWADETDDLDTEVSTSWHTEEDMYQAPAINRSILPTAPRSAREPNVDRSRIPCGPPYTAFLGNLPYDVTEDSIKDFFRGVGLSCAVRLPREPSNPDRLKGFGYAEFADVESLLSALSLNEENLGNRRIRVDIADQSNDKGRDNHSMGGRDRDRGGDFGPDKTDSDWRAPQPSGGESDDAPPRRDRSRDRYESDRPRGDDRYESDRPRGDNRYGGGQDRYRDRYDDRDRRDDRGGSFDCRGGGGRRAFGTGYRRDEGGQDGYRQDGYRQDDYRGSRDRYGDRGGDRYERREESRCDRDPGAVERPKLILKPRSLPKEVEQSSDPSAPSDRAASIFGEAKPVDTAAKEREMEERLKREQEKLQRQLEDRITDRKPRERHPSWRSEDQPAGRSRTGSESSQPGSRDQSGRASKRRESERSVDSGREEEPSSPVTKPSPPRQDSPPLKVVLAPPPKENAWAKRTTPVGGSSEGEARLPSPPAMTHPTAHQLS
ncbi:eukaryotic translation initiation factor 4B-like [Salvelinus namaycush]|uniref:Eukaryotic translation initiation factor 4B n=1 Tax=Salvelinus namaycush TaxID=8040 RepID=A0A8U1BVS8_SALNM|nr:eukaryotic translation initiation factor 4B-like [Salvelinus namaycush]